MSEDQENRNPEEGPKTLLSDNPESNITATEFIPQLDEDENNRTRTAATLILSDTGNDTSENVPEYAFDVGFDFEEDEEDFTEHTPTKIERKNAEQSRPREDLKSILKPVENPPADTKVQEEEELLSAVAPEVDDDSKTIITPPSQQSGVAPTQVLDRKELEKFGIISTQKSQENEEISKKYPSEQLTIVNSEQLRSAAEKIKTQTEFEKLPELAVDDQLHDNNDFLQEAPPPPEKEYDIMQNSYAEIDDDGSFGVETPLPRDAYDLESLSAITPAGNELDSDDTDLTDIMKFTSDEEDEKIDFGDFSRDLPAEDDFFNTNVKVGDALEDDEFNNISLNSIEKPEADFTNINTGLEGNKEADFENIELYAESNQKHPLSGRDEQPAELPEVSLAAPQGFDLTEDDDEMLLEPYNLGDEDEELQEHSLASADNEDFGTGNVIPEPAAAELTLTSENLNADDDVIDILDSSQKNIATDSEKIQDTALSADTRLELPEAGNENFAEFNDFSTENLEDDENINDILSAANQEADVQAEEILQAPAELPDQELELNENIIPEDDQPLSFESTELGTDDLDDSALIIEEHTASDSVNIPALDLKEDIEVNSKKPASQDLEADRQNAGEAEKLEQPIEDIFSENPDAAAKAGSSADWSDALEPVPLNAPQGKISDDDLASVLYVDGEATDISLTAPIEDADNHLPHPVKSKIFNVLKNIKKLVMLIGRRLDQIIYWTENWRIYLGVLSAIIITICTAIWIGSYMDSGES